MNELRSPEHLILLEVLKEVRKESGLRQIDLAQALGVPQSMISKIEVGERRLDILELRKICKALNVNMVDFINRFEMKLAQK